MNELKKMNSGLWYDANNNQELLKLRYACFDKCYALNQFKQSDSSRYDVIKDILGYLPDNLELLSSFNCDYGFHIHLGKNDFININNYFMDCADITIGNNVFVGLSCGFYTATHPLDFESRNKRLEKALPITVGDNCWIGSIVSIMTGVTIGSGCVIAAGSVVTKDVPGNVMVAGLTAKVVKTII